MSSTIIPALRYNDAPAAIEFLTKAFGFEVQMVVEWEGDNIEHAQLVHGTGMIMLGSHRDDDFGQLLGSDGRSSL